MPLYLPYIPQSYNRLFLILLALKKFMSRLSHNELGECAMNKWAIGISLLLASGSVLAKDIQLLGHISDKRHSC